MYRDNLPIEAVHKLQDLLELQPQEECNHVSDWMVYTSNPPKYKCKKCWYMTTEYMSQKEKTEETIEEKMVNISKRIWNNKHEQSILQKLRAELERMIKSCEVYDEEPAEYHSLVKLRSLLNELETQPEEKYGYPEMARDIIEATKDVPTEETQTITLEELEKKQESNTTFVTEWTPTPWEMIEVSNDREKWEDRPLKFKWMNNRGQYETWIYSEWYDNKTLFSFWNYARPAPEELKLEKLPEFTRNIVEEEAMNRHASNVITLAGQVDILIEQVSFLTTTVNLLIDKLK